MSELGLQTRLFSWKHQKENAVYFAAGYYIAIVWILIEPILMWDVT